MEKEKKPVYKKWWFWMIITLILILILYIMIFTSNIKPNFEVTDFKISSETTDYSSITNTTRYEGNGILTTSNKKGVYIVALKKTLTSGGSEESRQEDINMVLVSNGKGEFSTYDYGDVGKIEKPSYTFEIIGSQKIN